MMLKQLKTPLLELMVAKRPKGEMPGTN